MIMDVTSSIRIFAENLQNLRAVNLYVKLADGIIVDINRLPVLTVSSNIIEIPKLGSFKIVLDQISLQDCPHLTPRTIDKNVMCYRLIMQPTGRTGSAQAEVIHNFQRVLDDGSKKLVKNSINNVALKEGALYEIKCRFCTSTLGNSIKFDRIRPLPSKNWVEYAHELWYCHPPGMHTNQGLNQDVSASLNKVTLDEASTSSGGSKSIVELLKSPDLNYCFYGPCNWAVNKAVVPGIIPVRDYDKTLVRKALCFSCKGEVGSFTSDTCAKFWDFAVDWSETESKAQTQPGAENSPSPKTEVILNKAEQNFKSIVFATIYELSDHPTFRFTVSSTIPGNSVFLWNLDKNLAIYQQKSIPVSETDPVVFERCHVAKFFYTIKRNNVIAITDPKQIKIIQESEQNEQSILTVPESIFEAGIKCLEESSLIYSRNEKSLKCGFLIYDV